MEVFLLTVSEYYGIKRELEELKADVIQLKTDLESLRLKAVPEATPETPSEELPETLLDVSNVVPITEAPIPDSHLSQEEKMARQVQNSEQK